ncbi:MAG TPA: glycosyltransferase family 2 protein [Chitinophagaceae bacterium]|nr:glycosyltransferase family 2 protein [Chitinophagaceae bacterium]
MLIIYFAAMQLSIIIVNYNVKYFLEQCLYSVKAAIKNMEAEVWVADNNSADGSAEFLRKHFAWVKLIENKSNAGFAKANNQALQQCSGDYILFLNPDTIISENILLNCLQHFDSNKNCGALGVRMLDGNGAFLPESKRAFPSPAVSFWKLSGMSALFPHSKVFNRYALGYLNEKQTHNIEVLCGAFFMAPKNLLLQLNGFDEAFLCMEKILI